MIFTGSIDSDTSYFHYDTGLSHANYTHPEFVPFYIDEQPQDKVNRSREVCGGASASQACIFDYLATGDESLAKSSGDDAATSASDTASLGNYMYKQPLINPFFPLKVHFFQCW